MNTVYTVSAANTENSFEEHRFSVAGPFSDRSAAKKAAKEVEGLGYRDVRVHEAEDDR